MSRSCDRQLSPRIRRPHSELLRRIRQETVNTTTSVTVAPANVGSQPPTTPVISSAAVSPSRVDLTWTASVSSSGTLAGYRIYRDSNLLATVSANTLNYADTTVTPSSTYTYVVSAFDTAGKVSPSAPRQVSTPAPTSSGVSCPAPALNAFTGCYFDNVNLTGSPVLTRKDDQINFDWGRTSPGNPVPPANFSVRWQGYFDFDQGVYQFVSTSSDGMRVFLDGAVVLDNWRDQMPAMASVSGPVSPGSHLITVEFYERTGTASAHLYWQKQSDRRGSVSVPVISSFTASPSTIAAGSSSALTWSVSGATSITIDSGIGDVTNAASSSVSPKTTTTYTLTATNSAGSAQASVTVTVTGSGGSTPGLPAPINVTASVNGSVPSVVVNWQAGSTASVAGYQILRNGQAVADSFGEHAYLV